ncbi:MAG: hypothetical protein P8Y70_14990 [Candidatus Lokiarchaeota archaeon]
MINKPNDEDSLYEFIHETYHSPNKTKREGSLYISRSFFKRKIEESLQLSADWDKKTIPPFDPQYTQNHKNEPDKYGVISQIAKNLEGIHNGIDIEYTPKNENQAHCDINFDEILVNDKKLLNRIVREMREISRWEIQYPKLG